MTEPLNLSHDVSLLEYLSHSKYIWQIQKCVSCGQEEGDFVDILIPVSVTSDYCSDAETSSYAKILRVRD
jgi:hypothetical protein